MTWLVPNDFPAYVLVDSPTFGDDCLGHVLNCDRFPVIEVRLELDDDHPVMADVRADGFDPEQFEAIDYIHANDLRTVDGDRVDVKGLWRTQEDRERQAAANLAAELRRERERQMREGSRPRPAFPDLDLGLRDRQAR